MRLSGQDSRRGTFTQRHAVLYDMKTRERYTPLNNIKPRARPRFCVYNSPLSEYAVLGFDFGYALDFPDMLVLWEAQFGDFANGAQIIIDQYIVCSETKWGETSGIVLLLPHGYHGQGPEHSSARLERYLQACARGQHPGRPLLDARELLPHPAPPGAAQDQEAAHHDDPEGHAARSALHLAHRGSRRGQLPGNPRATPTPPKDAKRVILCTGKVYFDLADHRKAANIADTAIVRVEQLYPLHERSCRTPSPAPSPRPRRSSGARRNRPNMGAWTFIEPRLRKLFGRDIAYAGREASASTATGSTAIHELEQRELINQAFTL